MKTSHCLLLILLLAAALRIYGLSDESLWLDEGATVNRMELSAWDLLMELADQGQSVCYYAVERVWTELFGMSEFSLRFPSVIYGTLSVWVIFLLGNELFSPFIALLSALFLAVNPFAIFYAQDARPYSLLLMTSVFSLYFLFRVMKTPSKADKSAYLIFSSILLWTHPLAPLFIGVHIAALYLFCEVEGYETAKTKPGTVLKLILLGALIYLPQFFFNLVAIKAKLEKHSSAEWIARPDVFDLARTLRQYFMSIPMAIGVCLLIAAVLIWKFRRQPSARKALCLMAIGISAAIFAPLAISYVVTPVYVIRYTIPALAFLLLLLAWVISVLPVSLRWITLILFFGLTSNSLYDYYTKIDKDPWRQAAKLINESSQADDVVALYASYTQLAFQYYYPVSKYDQLLGVQTLEEAVTILDKSKRVWLVQAYDTHNKNCSDSIAAQLASNHNTLQTTAITGKEKLNPNAFWTADIRVTLFERSAEK